MKKAQDKMLYPVYPEVTRHDEIMHLSRDVNAQIDVA